MRTANKKQRVMIIGQPGAGKSTFARSLGESLDLPVVHIDLIHWQPGWIERSPAAKARLCAEVHARNEWVFEGGFSDAWPERLDRADTLIFLDFPLRIRCYRVLKRRLEYHGTTRPDLPENCPENINWEFLSFIWQTRKTGRAKMVELFEGAPGDKEKYRLCNRFEVARFLANVE